MYKIEHDVPLPKGAIKIALLQLREAEIGASVWFPVTPQLTLAQIFKSIRNYITAIDGARTFHVVRYPDGVRVWHYPESAKD